MSTHEKRYNELLALTAGRNRNYRAALFLLAAPMLADKRIEQYIKPDGIEWVKLMRTTNVWSTAERAFVKLAYALFTDRYKCDVKEAFWHLDRENVEIALTALRIRYN